MASNQDKSKNFKELQLEELLDVFREDFPVYGDFLRYFTIKLGDLPYEFSTTLFKVGLFYNELIDVVRGMFGAYVRLVMLEAGYLPFWAGIIPDEDNSSYQEEAIKAYEKAYEEGYIDRLITGEIAHTGADLDVYVNTKNTKECICIFELTEFPVAFKGKIIVSTFSGSIVDDLWEYINGKINKIHIKCSKSIIIVVDPILYRLNKKAIKDFKNNIKSKTGRDIVCSVDELIDMFNIDKQLFTEKWKQKRKDIISNLKGRYPFLSLHDEVWRIKMAQSEIKEALAELSKTELREKDCREIIWKISNAIGAYLGVIYHRWKNRSPTEKTFGRLLNELKREIESEFGEDVYNDLNFINEKRKIVDHPKPIKITLDDVIKVARKAELFQDLILLKLSLKGD